MKKKKKLLPILCALLLCALMLAPMAAFAAEEGNAVFVDTLEENFPLVYERSEGVAYEKNPDTQKTLYEKISATGDPLGTEYIVYKLDDSVVSFTIECMHVNGLGNPATDISVFVSADGSEWTEVETNCSDLTFDSDLYINEEMAYWMLSTIANKAPIEQGYNFIKIQFNPYTNEGAVVWDTVIDTISVEYGPTMAKEAPNVSTQEPTESPTEAPTEAPTEEPTTVPAETTAEASETAPAPAPSGDAESGNGMIWIVVVVVIAAAAGIAVVIVRKNKK